MSELQTLLETARSETASAREVRDVVGATTSVAPVVRTRASAAAASLG